VQVFPAIMQSRKYLHTQSRRRANRPQLSRVSARDCNKTADKAQAPRSRVSSNTNLNLTVIAPCIVAADVLKLFRRKIIRNVKLGANLVRGLALNHVSDGLASQIQKRLNIKKVCGL
jgi:hypothetical protein